MKTKIGEVAPEVSNWFDDTYWIHYHSDQDPWGRQETDGFGDAPHHTAYYIAARIWSGELTDEDLGAFLEGLEIRQTEYGLIRHPRTIMENGEHQLCNRDQFTPLIYCIAQYDEQWAEEIYKSNPLKIMWHHQKVHFKRSMFKKVNYFSRLLADTMELGDIAADLIRPNNSSAIKNWIRIEVAIRNQPTFMTKIVEKTFYKKIDIKRILTEYFTYRHNKDDDNPPPIHLACIRAIEKRKGVQG